MTNTHTPCGLRCYHPECHTPTYLDRYLDDGTGTLYRVACSCGWTSAEHNFPISTAIREHQAHTEEANR